MDKDSHYNMLQKKIEAKIEKKFRKYKVTGCSLAFIDGDKILTLTLRQLV